ncbi:trehalose-phosphatase [Streptomyces sp. NPDC005438]|uniref:trehalose-phosphatase n=1 Tax=Streptomyces sp. NPDC005438 TaxID=3156880 RepID=UPI0033B960CB
MSPQPAPPAPTTAEGRQGLDALLSDPRHALIALDFDGTLAPIVDDPDQARAHPRAVDALIRLAPRIGTLALITGRPAQTAAQNARLTDHPELSGVTVLGAYGAERWHHGHLTLPPPHPGVEALRHELPALLRRSDTDPGVHIEDKGHALAVHTRRAQHPTAAFTALEGPLHQLARAHQLRLEPGRLVLELRPPGADKGQALTDLVTSTGARAVVYGGDDLGDLPAYDALLGLRAAGTVRGTLVSAGNPEVTALNDRADLVVDGPEGVAELLERIAETLGD